MFMTIIYFISNRKDGLVDIILYWNYITTCLDDHVSYLENAYSILPTIIGNIPYGNWCRHIY